MIFMELNLIVERIKHLIQRHLKLDKEVYLCGSGTFAFFQILEDISFQDDEEVLLPDFLCEIVGIPLLISGVKFRLVDLKKGSILPSLNEYKEKYTSKTKAIFLAYLWGYVHEDLDAIIKWARKKHLIIIEDISSSYGLSYKGKNLGTLGDYTFGSFGKGKIINYGQYGFYTLLKKNAPSTNKAFSFFSKKIINYDSLIKKIRNITNGVIRKYLFLCLAKLHPLYLGYCMRSSDLDNLYNMLLKFSQIKQKRKNNTKFIFNNCKPSIDISLYPINNDQQITTRVCCTCCDDSLLLQLRKKHYWVGSDFRYPISKLLGQKTEKNTDTMAKHVFNVLTEPDNITLKKTIHFINKWR